MATSPRHKTQEISFKCQKKPMKNDKDKPFQKQSYQKSLSPRNSQKKNERNQAKELLQLSPLRRAEQIGEAADAELHVLWQTGIRQDVALEVVEALVIREASRSHSFFLFFVWGEDKKEDSCFFGESGRLGKVVPFLF